MRKWPEPEKSVCIDCGTEITKSDEPWDRGSWYDEDVLDYDNNGRACPETGDEHYPIHIITEEQEIEDVLV